MITIKESGMRDVKLTSTEFNLLVQSLRKMIELEKGGMFVNGSDIVDKQGMKMAKIIIKKF